MAGAAGIEPGNGGIKIAGGKKSFKPNSDSSCSVHIKQDQAVSTPVGTLERRVLHPYHPAEAITVFEGVEGRCAVTKSPRNEALIHRIYIEPTTIRGERGQHYRVHYQGAVLIDDAWNPEFEACRALLARGITGRLEVWRPGGTFPGSILDIAKAARLTVEESATVSARIVSWAPFSMGAGSETQASDGGAGTPAARKEIEPLAI